MRKLTALLALFLAVSTAMPTLAAPKHALARVASVAVAPVVHPVKSAKFLSKATLGSVLFAVETGVDGARLGLEGADKALDAISIKGRVPVLDAVYAFVSVGAKDAAKADAWLERQEDYLLGRHN